VNHTSTTVWEGYQRLQTLIACIPPLFSTPPTPMLSIPVPILHVPLPMPFSSHRYHLQLFAKQIEEAGSYSWAMTYLIDVGASGVLKGGFPTTYGSWGKAKAVLLSPMAGTLPRGKKATFRIKFLPGGAGVEPGVTQLRLTVDKEWTPADLIQCPVGGNEYVGELVVGKGAKEVSLYFGDGSGSYSGLGMWKAA